MTYGGSSELPARRPLVGSQILGRRPPPPPTTMMVMMMMLPSDRRRSGCASRPTESLSICVPAKRSHQPHRPLVAASETPQTIPHRASRASRAGHSSGGRSGATPFGPLASRKVKGQHCLAGFNLAPYCPSAPKDQQVLFSRNRRLRKPPSQKFRKRLGSLEIILANWASA